MKDSIEEVLNNLRRPFVIPEDGTSQTRLSNTGRVGFYIERLFGIDPNNCRRPDFGNAELKTMQQGKKISIGTMPESEFRSIKNTMDHIFEQSDPYNKMKNTLVVVYQKLRNYPEPLYQMEGWGTINLAKMPAHIKAALEKDYTGICKRIGHCKNRDQVTDIIMRHGSISGEYLTLGYKGQGQNGYNYPSWEFQVKFTRLITHA
jgi:hypothetical protein